MRKVLVLEDEDNIRSFVVLNLNRAGYDTLEATTGEEALEILREHPETRIALLDVNLPGIDGFEVCRRIRATNSKMGIIMLTARTLEMDKVTGLMTGADDYVTKPFSPAELTARVDALYQPAFINPKWFSLICVFTVNLLCHSGKPQIKIHARRYKDYFWANLSCLPQCHACFYSGSLRNIVCSQHNSMSCFRITTDCHRLPGKFWMMQHLNTCVKAIHI